MVMNKKTLGEKGTLVLLMFDPKPESPAPTTPVPPETHVVPLVHGHLDEPHVDLSQPLPRVIHQMWIGPRPCPLLKHERRANWKDFVDTHAGWRYEWWDTLRVHTLIQQHYRHLWPCFSNLPQVIMQADLARYVVLHHVGGVYVDLDVTPRPGFAALVDLAARFPVSLAQCHPAASFHEETVLTWLITSHPRASLWPLVFAEIARPRFTVADRIRATVSNFHRVLARTGSVMLMRVQSRHWKRQGRRRLFGVIPYQLANPGRPWDRGVRKSDFAVVEVVSDPGWDRSVSALSALTWLKHHCLWFFLALWLFFMGWVVVLYIPNAFHKSM